MGTPVPEDWPSLEDLKWYIVTEDNYGGDGPAPGCRLAPTARVKCCRRGDAIKAYIDAGNQCQPFAFLCIQGSPVQKKVVCLMGPFDTQAACQLEL